MNSYECCTGNLHPNAIRFFGVRGIGGIVGPVLTGLLASKIIATPQTEPAAAAPELGIG